MAAIIGIEFTPWLMVVNFWDWMRKQRGQGAALRRTKACASCCKTGATMVQ
jgi:hypothetical protein